MQPRRTVFTILLVSAAIMGCAAGASETAPSFTPEDSTAIRASIDGWIKATLDRDTALFRTTITDDVLMYPGNQAPVRGADAAVATLAANPTFTSFKVDVHELDGHGDVAYDHGIFTVDVRLPDGIVVSDTGSFATKFRKGADGKWAHQWVMWHSNRPAAPAP
ncbi:MAG TPA: DUF4440 domain-containing protein [Gemmatimonadaceae bacterium]|nr:DUF4440 domain-containing protein [Gemmatimonadaceae bacterium]